MRCFAIFLLGLGLTAGLSLTATAQLIPQPKGSASTVWNPWENEHSGSHQPLRGIHAVGNGVAWASGARGTVLRTEDSGYVWQGCAMPEDAEKLDFRSIWAWDAQRAIVMSSGPGDQSRLYKTTDGCAHWTALGVNQDANGFWDGLAFSDEKNGYLLGDPVNGHLTLLRTADGGVHWKSVISKDLDLNGQKPGAFAASNQSMVLTGPVMGDVWAPWFGTSGMAGGSTPTSIPGDWTAEWRWRTGIRSAAWRGTGPSKGRGTDGGGERVAGDLRPGTTERPEGAPCTRSRWAATTPRRTRQQARRHGGTQRPENGRRRPRCRMGTGQV